VSRDEARFGAGSRSGRPDCILGFMRLSLFGLLVCVGVVAVIGVVIALLLRRDR
jgi:hypothetical protein